MSFGLLELLLQIGLAIHAYRTGRMNPWLWIILFLPGIGSLLYIILEVAPELVSGRAANKMKRGLVATMDPGRDYRALAREVEIAPTVHNRLKLADECPETGPHAGSRPALRTKRHRPARGRSRHPGRPGAHAASPPATWTAPAPPLDALRAENPDWRPADVQLLYARVQEGQGQTQEALSALRAPRRHLSRRRSPLPLRRIIAPHRPG